MSKNDKKWYFQGLADKLSAANLTWSNLKLGPSGSNIKFLNAMAYKIGLTIPMEGNKIHPQVRSNINILWQALRGKNTGAFTYTEEEVYIYWIMLSAIIAKIRYVAKTISLANVFDPLIPNLAKDLLASATETNGVTRYTEIITNKPEFVTRINAVCKDVNTYALKGCTLNSRWNYIADKCFSDYNGPKAVKCVFSLGLVPTFVENAGVVTIEYIDFTKTNNTIAKMITDLETQVSIFRTVNGGNLLRVAGDMIKLLGAKESSFNNVPYYNGGETPEFTYDKIAIDQIHNAKCVNANQTTAVVPSFDGSISGVLVETIEKMSGTISDNLAGILDANETLIVSDTDLSKDYQGNLELLQFQCNVSVTEVTANTKWTVGVVDCGTTIMMMQHARRLESSGTFAVYTLTSVASDYSAKLDTNSSMLGLTNIEDPEIVQNDALVAPFIVTNIGKFYRYIDIDNFAFMSKLQYVQMNNVAVYSQTYFFKPSDLDIKGLL